MNTLFLTGLAASIFGAGADLKVDPLLVVATGEVWDVIGKADNPVWPGWDAADTPILIYLPGVQDVLINHPNTPADFTAYDGPVKSQAGRIFVRDGKTVIDFDGQNTSRDIFGVQTLVVADTISNRKQDVSHLLSETRTADEKSRDLTYDQLRPNPYSQLALVAHEAFHVFQHRKAPNKGGNELALAKYPVLSVGNNVGWAMEGEALAAALRAKTKEDARSSAIQWLSVRNDRRKELSAEAIQYEDGTEFNEGLAKYVEYRLFQVLQERDAGPQLYLAQGFRGFADLTPERERMIGQVLAYLRGEVNVNNDPYGAAPARMRMYYSGMAIAATLDRLTTGWQDRILQPSTTLTGLANDAIHATSDELAAALVQAKSEPGYGELVRGKERLAQEGRGYVARILDEIEKNPHGVLVVDYSALGNPGVNLSFTPFGILAADEFRTIYRMVPLSARIGSALISQTESRPALEDKKSKQFTFPLTGDPSSAVASIGEALGATDSRTWKTIELPGVKLERLHGTIRRDGRRVIVELKPR